MKRDTIRLNLAVVFTCLLFTVPIITTYADEGAVNQDINSIENIEFGATDVEIHLKSSRPFPVRAIPPVLRIGSKLFNRSVRDDNGELSKLIFLLSPKDFSQLKAADSVRVVYGRGESPRERWDFGSFEK